MNKQRRKTLCELKERMIDIITEIEAVKYDEETAYDNMPEGLQCSLRGEDSQEAINVLDEIIDGLNEIMDSFNEIV